MYNLFSKFPIISYNGNPSINILASVKFTDVAKRVGAIYYPYVIQDGERPDLIAANYYDDPRYSWVVYMSNGIIDPQHDWPLTESEFRRFIEKKYGSVYEAQNNIAYWRVNWTGDETMLSISGYNALPSYNKKYFAPIVGNHGATIGYQRSQLDLAVETNMIQRIDVDNTTNFVVGEEVTQKTSGVVSATACVQQIGSDYLIVNHVLGEFHATSGGVGGLLGKTGVAVVSAITTLASPISLNEAVYWTYVTQYDYENEVNEQKRYIKLIDRAYLDQIESEMDTLLAS